MRIAYVCTDPGVPVFGRKGSSVHVQEVVRGLIGHGATVDLFAVRFDGAPPADLRTVSVHHLPAPPPSDITAREQFLVAANADLESALDRHGPFDVVYERHALWSFAAMEYATRCGIAGLLEVNAPLVEEQATYRELINTGEARRAAARAFAGASALLAVSQPVADYLDAQVEAKGRVHVLPNGVDPLRIRPGVVASRPGSPGSFTVGFVGTLKPWHGLETLIEAFAELYERNTLARLLVVGDGPERGRIEETVRARGMAGAVHWCGAVDPGEIAGLLASMDTAVAPYPELERFYFSPLKLYEYMAAGLPVVASRVGQVAEVVEDGATGLLCPPGDAIALAQALTRLAEDPALRAKLGANARQSVLRDHTWSAVTARALELAGCNPRLVATAAGAG